MPEAPSPPLELETIEAFGPRRAYVDAFRTDTAVEPERLVKTHCCFCGQQCGMQLKVARNVIVGVEPWYDFPFNRGMMCPKGVKRYLQQSHPDRLLHAYEKDPASPSGFRVASYDQAIRRVADAIDRIQREHGPDAFAVLTGASLTTEKCYLMGKFAHMCLRTANIDYNGRLCMVSAAAGNKKAFGIDRAANPWADILGAEVVWISGANIAECAPITTNYVWQAREQGAKVIVVDPRITPIARTCDLFLPIKPGRDTALFNGVLHLMIENDWLDHAFIAEHTVGFEAVAQEVAAWTPRRTAEVTGIAERSIRQAAEWWGTAKTSFQLHARGLEHHSNGVLNVLSAINIVLASGRIGRPNCGYGTITGQGNGQGGREHGQKADQLPGGRDLDNPEHRAHVAGVWGMEPDELPMPGADAYEIIRKIDRGEIKGLLSVCFNPVVSLPDNNVVRRALEKLDFYVNIDFFLSETGRYADVVLPGSLQEEDEGTVTQLEGRIIKINKAVDCPGEARRDWQIIQDIAKALGRERGLTFSGPKEMFEELRVASKGGVIDYSGVTWERVEQNYGVFWPCPDETPDGVPLPGPQGTVRLFEPGSWNPVARGAGPFYFPDGKARFNVTPYKGPAEDVDAEYPIILTTGRVVSQFLSGNQTRRIGPLVDHYPEPRIELHPILAERLGISDGDWTTAESRRGTCTLRASVVQLDADLVDIHRSPRDLHVAGVGGAHHPAGHSLRPLPLGGPEERQPAHHLRSGSNLEDPGVQGLFCAGAQGGRPARVRKQARAPAIGATVGVPEALEFFVDPARCIGCQACVQACTECDTHRGVSMIQLDFIDKAHSTQTVPMVCMHCDAPTCAEVCPADAIKRTEDGVVQTARKPRCIACNNCVLACPFGVPKMHTDAHLMMKCDMCYDRTSVGLKPMCASVCPSQALSYGTREEMARLRPRARPVNTFRFGNQLIRTKVNIMVPLDEPGEIVDVTASMHDPTVGHELLEGIFTVEPEGAP